MARHERRPRSRPPAVRRLRPRRRPAARGRALRGRRARPRRPRRRRAARRPRRRVRPAGAQRLHGARAGRVGADARARRAAPVGRRRRAAAAPARQGRAAAAVRRRRLRRLLVLDRACVELRTDLPARLRPAAAELAPHADRLPRPLGDGRRERHAGPPPGRPEPPGPRRAAGLRAEREARRRARARLRRRDAQRARRAGGGRPRARPRLRRRAAQRLERAGPAGVRVPAARAVPRQVVRDLDLAVGDADGGARAVPRRAVHAPGAGTGGLPARGALGAGHRARDRAERRADRGDERAPPLLERRPADRAPHRQRRVAAHRRPARLGDDLGAGALGARLPARAVVERRGADRAIRRRGADVPRGRRRGRAARRRGRRGWRGRARRGARARRAGRVPSDTDLNRRRAAHGILRAMLPRLAALAVLLAASLAACGSGGRASGSTSTAAPAGDTTATSDASGSTATTPPARAAQARRGVRLVRIGGFSAPVYVTQPPGDDRRLFVVEQGGRIMMLRGGRKVAQPFLDIRSSVLHDGEQGLLSVAFPPDYQQSGLFYVYYTERNGEDNRIVEYHRASADRANPSSARLVLQMPNFEPNHNGGLMLFGPDGLMYVGTGDGGGGDDQHGARGHAQDLGSPLGKLLRIDPRAAGGQPYRIPSSNPFAGRAGARGEVYAYGLRNPWRFSFDRRTGDLAIADVGQDAVEEVDFVRKGRAKGRNFGWRPWEGRSRNFDEPAPGAIFPVITHQHSDGFCSITGGYVVRDRGVPALFGRYVYGDYCEGRIRAARLRAGHRTTGKVLALPKVGGLSSFGQDAAGRVYATSLNGPVYRIAAR